MLIISGSKNLWKKRASTIGGGSQILHTVTRPRTYLNTARSVSVSNGTIHIVSNGDNLQTVIDSAVAGDIIRLAPGGVWNGIVLPEKSGAGPSNWITIEPDGPLMPEGIRATSAWSGSYHFPKVRTINNFPALLTSETGVPTYYRIRNIELTADPGVTGCNVLVHIGTSQETVVTQIAHHFILEQCVIHGHPTLEMRRAVYLDGGHSSLIDSSIFDSHSTGFDTQAVLFINSPGPLKVTNCYLEASTENIGGGGADPRVIGQLPRDIEIRGNHMFTPMSYLGGPWLIKNSVEFKLGQYIDIIGNVLENKWPNGQLGWAFVLWSVNQDGGAYWSQTSDMTVQYNLIKNHAAGVNLSAGYIDGSVRPFIPFSRLAMNNNLFIGTSNPVVGDGGYGFLLGGAFGPGLSIEHNTFFRPYYTVFGWSAYTSLSDHVVSNNLLGAPHDPIIVQGSFDAITSGASECRRNVFMPLDNYGHFVPDDNFFPTTEAEIKFLGGAGGFVYDPNAAVNGFRLAPDSPYVNAGTDGTDLGVDIDGLNSAITGVVT